MYTKKGARANAFEKTIANVSKSPSIRIRMSESDAQFAPQYR
jgi:hypothetical protein